MSFLNTFHDLPPPRLEPPSPALQPRTKEWLIAIVSLTLSLSTALFGAGYSYRKVEDLIPRVSAIEHQGSTQAQISAKDIQWLKDQDEKILKEVTEIRQLVQRHMERDARK